MDTPKDKYTTHTFVHNNAIVTVNSPILTPEERQRRIDMFSEITWDMIRGSKNFREAVFAAAEMREKGEIR